MPARSATGWMIGAQWSAWLSPQSTALVFASDQSAPNTQYDRGGSPSSFTCCGHSHFHISSRLLMSWTSGDSLAGNPCSAATPSPATAAVDAAARPKPTVMNGLAGRRLFDKAPGEICQNDRCRCQGSGDQKSRRGA